MASITRPDYPSFAPPRSRPLAPHPGLEIDRTLPPPVEIALPRASRLSALQQWLTVRLALTAAAVLAFIGGSVVYFLSLTNNLSTEGDNAIYIILAKSLATGHGYMNIQDPSPRIEAQFPPLFSVLLTPIVRIWGTDAVLNMQALVTAFAIGSFALSFFLFRRWTGSALLALAIVGAYASSDLVWSFSHKVLTEIPYMFFTLLTCWWATRYAEQPYWRSWTGVLVALAAAAAFLTRTIGLSLCVALPLYLLFSPPISRQLRRQDWLPRLFKAGLVGVILAVLAGGWTLRNRLVYSGEGHNYLGQFTLKQTYVPDAGHINFSVVDFWNRAVSGAQYYLGVYQRMLGGHVWDHVPSYGGLSQGLLAISIVGFVYAFMRRRTLAEFYVAGYVGIVLLWPWTDLRFAVPLMPFMIYYLALALSLPLLLLAKARPIDARVAAAMIVLPLAAPTANHTYHQAMNDRRVGYHYEIERHGEWVAYGDWRDFYAAAMWLKRYALPGSVVINRSPNLLYLWTGLKSRNYPYSLDWYSVLTDISKEHNDYLLYDHFTWTYTTPLYVGPVVRRYKDNFVQLKWINGTTIYQVVSP